MASPFFQTASGAALNYQTSANWSTLVAPTTGDAVTIANSGGGITLGLLNAATLASLTVPLTFTGTAGLAAQATKAVTGITRASSTATLTSTAHGYVVGDSIVVSGAVETEYNGTFTVLAAATADTLTYAVSGTPTTPATGTILVRQNDYLIQPATLATFGAAGNNTGTPANGSGRFKWNAGSVATTATVLATSQSVADTNFEPLRIIGTHASNVLYMLGGLVGLATTTVAEVATFATISQTGGTLNAGAGLTWTTIYQSGGTLNLAGGAASGAITQTKDATARLAGAGTVANLTIGGTCHLDLRKATAGDTVTGTLELAGGTLDLSGNPAAISVGTLKTTGDCTVILNKANPGHLSWTTLTRSAGSTLTFK